MNKKNLIIIAIAVLVIGVMAGWIIKPAEIPTIPLGGSPDLTIFQNSATNSSSSASTTATLVVAQNSGRQLLKVCNNAGVVVYLSEKTTSTAVTANTGIRLNAVSNANSCYETGFNSGYVYTGQVWAITVAGTSSLTIFER